VLEWMAGKERLGQGGTQARRNLGSRGRGARDIDSEAGGGMVSVSMGEKRKQKEYRGRKMTL